MQKLVLSTVAFLGFGLSFSQVPVCLAAQSLSTYQNKPKLVVLLVLDQFRSDYLTRFSKRFLPATLANGDVGGFQYLMAKGAYFPYGQYDILQSMTGPGHSTTLSGAYPYQSGIPANDWYNSKTKEPVYCVEDPDSPTVGAAVSDKHIGTSPKNFLATTVGDELKNAGYPSRVVSVAIKDRASILMGGHRADLAIWFDGASSHWVSSKFYLPNGELPEWVQKLNQTIDAKKGQAKTWQPSGNESGLSLKTNPLPASAKKENKEFGVAFPHTYQLGSKDSIASPYGTEITAQAADSAVDAFKLGNGASTDLLAVSFSSHDYVGHAFGPNSREMEEMTIDEDKVIAGFLNSLRKKVPGGMKNILVVLTADHGIPPNPDWLKKERVPAGRFDEKKIAAQMNELLAQKFGEPSSSNWILSFREFSIYLNHKALEDKNLSRAAVEDALKGMLLANVEGLAHVFTFTDFLQHRLPPGMFERQIMKTYFPGRSGDVMLIPRPYFIPGSSTVTHMTGYNYDRTVPILFAGARIQAGVFSEPAEVVDIAPTLSFLLGIVPPSQSEGKVLSQILR